LTQQSYDALGHGDSCAAALQYHSDDGTQGDDNSDATEDAAKPPGNVSTNLQQRQLIGEPGQQGCTEQGQERMQFELRRYQHDEDDQGGQNQNQSHYGVSCMNGCRTQRCWKSALFKHSCGYRGKLPNRRAPPAA